MGHLGRPPEPKLKGNDTPQVSSVVQVPGKAKVESNECPKIQALRARLKEKYGGRFLCGKPVFPPPVRGPYGEPGFHLRGRGGSIEPPKNVGGGGREKGSIDRHH